MIDPACGSGHFLLGGFERLLREWQRLAPEMPPGGAGATSVETLSLASTSIPSRSRSRDFACWWRRCSAAEVIVWPRRRVSVHLAAGDSLLHGRHFFQQRTGRAAEGFRRVLRHHYVSRRHGRELDRFWDGNTTSSWATRPTSPRRTRRCGMLIGRFISVAT